MAILVPDYQIDGVLWLKKHFEGGYLVRKLIVVEAFVDDDHAGGLADRVTASRARR